MKPIKVLYVDDEAIQHNVTDELFKQLNKNINVHYYFNGDELLFNLPDHLDTQLIILDVEMPGKNGLEVAHIVREILPTVPLVFITAYGQYAIKGYGVFAMDYLLKPVTLEQLSTLFKRLEQIAPEVQRSIILEINQEPIRINESDIFSIESFGHQQVLTLRDKQIEVSISMKELLSRLSDHFISTHRSYAVNINYVHQIQKEHVLLENKKLIQLSRRNYKEGLNEFVKHYQSKEYSL